MIDEEVILILKGWIKRDRALPYADREENIEIYGTAIKAIEDRAKLKEAIRNIKKIFKQKSKSDDWECIHDLQIWEEAFEILNKHTEGLV